MFKFFEIIDDLGLRAVPLAERMGVSHPLFWRVRAQKHPPTHDFMLRARAAFRQMGIRRPDGQFYTVDDLFYPEDEIEARRSA